MLLLQVFHLYFITSTLESSFFAIAGAVNSGKEISLVTSHESQNYITLSMVDIITRTIFNRKWNYKQSYNNAQEFLQAIPDILEQANVKDLGDLFYLTPYRKSTEQSPPYDLNVLPVWIEDENFGQDIRVAIVGDGLDSDHPDLVDNYDSKIAEDYIRTGSLPRLNTADNFGREGTRAAGLIAMKFHNGLCGVGVAPKAKIGAIRLFNGSDTAKMENLTEALKSLSQVSNVDIVLNTSNLASKRVVLSAYHKRVYEAYEETAIKGRNGKGLIHVVPIGEHTDNVSVNDLSCARSLNVNNIYTIGVAATEYDGTEMKNSASCAAVMVTAYATDGNTNPDYKIRTTDVNGECTTEYKNTEAAASLVAGVLALVLKANPSLTYRDIKHLITMTSEVAPIAAKDSNTWRKNDAGFYVSHSYGFGMINAYNLVQMAKTFQSVPPMATCILSFTLLRESTDDFPDGYLFRAQTDGCQHTDNEVNYIEHVQLHVTMKNYLAKVAHIKIVSPQKTSANLLKLDASDNGVLVEKTIDWIFDSMMSWGEPAKGEWIVIVRCNPENSSFAQSGPLIHLAEVTSLTLYIHGTKDCPKHYKNKCCCLRKYRSYMKPVPPYLL